MRERCTKENSVHKFIQLSASEDLCVLAEHFTPAAVLPKITMPICKIVPKRDKLIEDVNICDRIESEVACLAKP